MSRKIIYLLLLFSVSILKASGQGEVPALNKKIVSYVKSVIGKQVDRGECWDLANQALSQNNAKWDGEYVYGDLLDLKKDDIYPGDIIQFKKVKVTYSVGNAIYKETMTHHTAIVYKVISKGKFELAHQNTGFSGRKVGLSTLDLSTIVKGKIFIYRPISR